ncbi:hypothetical protein QBC44DRAFT_38748 [Cladorrhinum sp. PSN332]|nr:hypothetical protein QBC44DRAFT_38748 [Cladorrhinum sp. PSN332]
MSRQLLHHASLLSLTLATSLTLLSIPYTNWITLTINIPSSSSSSSNGPHAAPPLTDSFGLFQRCTSPGSGPNRCVSFPEERKCSESDMPFCNLWWTAGVLLGLAVPLMQVLTVVAFVRCCPKKWKLPAGVLVLTSGVQGFGVTIMAYLFDHDELFWVPGYQLGLSWYLAFLSAGTMFLTACGMAIGASVLPTEKEYKLVLSEKSGV